MIKKVVSLLLIAALLLTAFPLSAFAASSDNESIPGVTPSTQDEASVRTATGNLNLDERLNEEYPYGTFAFGCESGEITEGDKDGKDKLRIPVYRFGGVSGSVTVLVNYAPYVSADNDGNEVYAWSMSALDDVKISYEKPNPKAEKQRLGYPEIKPSEDGIDISIGEYKPTEEEAEAVSNPEQFVTLHLNIPEGEEDEYSDFMWQYKEVGESDRNWTSPATATLQDLSISMFDIIDENKNVIMDYRVIYKHGDEYFCTPTLMSGDVFDPKSIEATEEDNSPDELKDAEYEECKVSEKYDAFQIPLTFADGESVKYISVSAIDNSEFELDKMGTFSIFECMGGKLSDICSSFLITKRDDDNDDIKTSTIGFVESKYTADKDDESVTVEVKRKGDIRYITTVKYFAVSKTAIEGENFAKTSGEIMLGAGGDTATIDIPLIKGSDDGKDIDFTLQLGEIRGGDGKCTIEPTKATTNVEIPHDLKEQAAVENGGVVKEGGSLTGILGSSTSSDISDMVKDSENSLLFDENASSDDDIEQVAVPEDLAATISTNEHINTYDYGALTFRRDNNYNNNNTYWKDKEAPYYTDSNMKNSDTQNYTLSGEECIDSGKGGLTAKSDGKGILACNYYTKSPAALNIDDAGLLFSHASFKFDVLKVAVKGEFPLFWKWNYTMPWVNLTVDNLKYDTDFIPQEKKSDPLSQHTYENNFDIPLKQSKFHLDMNCTLNDQGENKREYAKFSWIPSDCTELQLSRLEFNRRVLTNTKEIGLRIYTANDADSNPDTILTDNIYKNLEPKVSLVQHQSGVTSDGNLYVGSKLCVTLGSAKAYKAYKGDNVSSTVFVTDKDGNRIPAKIESGVGNTFYITMLWDTISEADLSKNYRINVVYERQQGVNFNITPSLQIDSKTGNVLNDKEHLNQSWNEIFKRNGQDVEIQIGYSKYDKDESSGFTNETYTTKFSTFLKDISSPIGKVANEDIGINNIQWINFHLAENDVILFNGEQYRGDEPIELTTADLAMPELNFIYYNSKCLDRKSDMTITFSYNQLYFDGNANGKIDGYFDEQSGLFMLDEKSGDTFCCNITKEIPEEYTQPQITADGKIQQYFIKCFYTISPRSLNAPDNKKTAQILPCFTPQNTDEESLAKFTDEQKTCRMIKTTGTEILPFSKKTKQTGKKYTLKDTAMEHEMYGAAATKLSAVDFPLGGDMRIYKNVEINGKQVDLGFGDYAGNLRFNFNNPDEIIINDMKGNSEGVSDVNGFLGSFVNSTTFVCGVQETRELKSVDDFKAESVANGEAYARPCSSVENSAETVPKTPVNIDYTGNDVQIEKLAGFNSSSVVPSMGISALGFDVTFTSGNQIYLSLGFPVFSREKTLNKPKKTKDGEEINSGDEKNGVNIKKIKDDQKEVKEEKTTIKKSKTFVDNGKTKSQDETIEKIDNGGSGVINKTVLEKDQNGNVENKLKVSKTFQGNDDSDANAVNKDIKVKKNFWDQTTKGEKWRNALNVDDIYKTFTESEWDKGLDPGEASKATLKFGFTVTAKALCILEYNELYGGWNVSSANFSVSAMVSFSFRVTFPIPLFYFFVNVSGGAETAASLEYEQKFTEKEPLIKEAKTLSYGETETQTLNMSGGANGIIMRFTGKLNIKLYDSPQKNKCLLKGSLLSDGKSDTNLRFSKYVTNNNSLYLELTASEGKDKTVNLTKLATSDVTNSLKKAEWTLSLSINAEAGFGVGVPFISAELFGNVGYNATFALRPQTYVKRTIFNSALSMRFKIFFLKFNIKLIGITITRTRDNPGAPMKKSVTREWIGGKIKDDDINDVNLDFVMPDFNYDAQEFSGDETDSGSDTDSGDNSYHPTDKTVNFELSGYSGAGDAVKLADGLDTGFNYKAIDINGNTYVLFLVADKATDNSVNASRLVLSKVETMGEAPGLKNPITGEGGEKALLPVDPTSTDATATGDVSYSYSVEGSKLNVIYTCYDKHFDKSETPTPSELGTHTVVKMTSIDLPTDSTQTSTGFTTPKVITHSNGIFRSSPETAGDNAFYLETVSSSANSVRDDNLRAYLKAVYGVTEEDFKATEPRVEVADYILRYKTQKELDALNGDGNDIVAVTPDGKSHVAKVGSQSGEKISEFKMQKVGDKYLAFFISQQDAYFDPSTQKTVNKESFNANTDYGKITRLCCKVFNGNDWEDKTYIIRQVVDFDRCDKASDESYPLVDGIYAKGALETKCLDPLIYNLKYLNADLDGSGAKPVLAYEMNSNTYLFDNEALVSLLSGNSATAKKIFSSEDGKNVAMASDKDGKMALAYTKQMDNTDNNAIYCAWWDTQQKTWGTGTMLAMNHMNVFENIKKFNLSDEQQEKAYHGETTGNAEYDKYVEENKEQGVGGALDRTVFQSIQLLPSTIVEKQDDGQEDKRTEKLILVTSAITSTLEKDTYTQQKDITNEYYKEKENKGLGIYAISFGAGQANIGNENIKFDVEEFNCGSKLSGECSFDNTGSAAIRGSVDQPISVKLIANTPDGNKYSLSEHQIKKMIASGESVNFKFNTIALPAEIPDKTEFSLLISEDEEYIKKFGGTPFSRMTKSLYTVNKKYELSLESLDYNVISSDEDNIYIGTEFVVTNRGLSDVDEVAVQYTAVPKLETVETSSFEGEEEVLDITGSELRVSNQTKIGENSNNGTDMKNGIIVLHSEDDPSDASLKAGYMRSVSGVLCVKRDQFSKLDEKGLNLKCVVYSTADSYVKDMENGQLTKTGSEEARSENNKAIRLISQETFFNVPENIKSNIENTLRVPVSYTSTQTENEIVVEEVEDGTETWHQVFNDVHYAYEQNVIVAVAKQTGHTLLRIEDRKTNSFKMIAVEVKNDGFGRNIYIDDDSFKFKNADGQDYGKDPIKSEWKFIDNLYFWKGEAAPPMSNNVAEAKKAGAKIEFTTVATTMTIFYSGKIRVISDKFLSKDGIVADNTGKVNSPLTVQFDNLEGKQHTITIIAETAGTQIDRYCATYPEDAGFIVKSSDDSPDFYWARSFPNTASLKESEKKNGIRIKCYVLDDYELKSLTANGEPIPAESITKSSGSLWSFVYTFHDNGDYNFTATDIYGNTTTHHFSVYWFNPIPARDALYTAPGFSENALIAVDEKYMPIGPNKQVDKAFLAINYSLIDYPGEKFDAYTARHSANIIKPENAVQIKEGRFARYPYVVDVDKNNFYIVRDIHQNGTWSLAIVDLKVVKVPLDWSVSLKDAETNPYIMIYYNAFNSRTVPENFLINGYKLKNTSSDNYWSGNARFDINYSGEYQIGWESQYSSNNGETKVLNAKIPCHLAGEIDVGTYTPFLGNPKEELIIDPNNICGFYYDTKLSDPKNNKYVAQFDINTEQMFVMEGRRLKDINYENTNHFVLDENVIVKGKIVPRNRKSTDDVITFEHTSPENIKSGYIDSTSNGICRLLKIIQTDTTAKPVFDGDKEKCEYQWYLIKNLPYGGGDYRYYEKIDGATNETLYVKEEYAGMGLACNVTGDGIDMMIHSCGHVAYNWFNFGINEDESTLKYNGEEQTFDAVSLFKEFLESEEGKEIFKGDINKLPEFVVTDNTATEPGEYVAHVSVKDNPDLSFDVPWRIVKVDNPVPTSNPKTDEATMNDATPNENPKTGDYTNVFIYVGIVALGVVLITILLATKKKKKDNE